MPEIDRMTFECLHLEPVLFLISNLDKFSEHNGCPLHVVPYEQFSNKGTMKCEQIFKQKKKKKKDLFLDFKFQ